MSLEEVKPILKNNLERIVLQKFEVPLEKCEVIKLDENLNYIIRKQNSLQIPKGFQKLELNKQYAVSESILCFATKCEMPMHSHEGVLYEIAEVFGKGDIALRRCFQNGKLRAINVTRLKSGRKYNILDSDITEMDNKPKGFFHQLYNPDDMISYAKIILIAEKDLLFKDRQILEFGLNHPPNSYKPAE